MMRPITIVKPASAIKTGFNSAVCLETTGFTSSSVYTFCFFAIFIVHQRPAAATRTDNKIKNNVNNMFTP